MLPPAAPTGLPEEKAGRLTIACPGALRTQSLDGRPVPVAFALPATSGGQAPVAVACTPASGHPFRVGSTEVSCSASDDLRQAASCAFPVTVVGPPMLAVTRFLAFGDSVTAGVVSPPQESPPSALRSRGRGRLDPALSYASLLERDLRARYRTQPFTVVNEGLSGEEARDAVARFGVALRLHAPEVVLLMQGTNDLHVVGGGGAASAARAIDAMVGQAQRARVDVMLMTIPPQRDTEAAALVPGFNDRIRAVAAGRGVLLVDIHEVLLRGRCPGVLRIPCIGLDGLHPTAAGHQLIADELARVIVERYDVETPAGF